ncbi:LCP family protein [Lacticigenium naphthae]|uniref:LCP family glycopolymer transferase n=1 Tax=Lacticigenium naphthae TaxID=515351 RepID=UPI00042173A9|nr:LCP family protein [Lacticigenium naphthae]
MPQTRLEKKQLHKKNKKRNRFLRILGVLALIAVATIGILVWKVYSDVVSTSDNIYSEVTDKEERRTKPVDVDGGEDPFSVLLMGIDTGFAGRTDQGRSDTIMLMTVNPKKNETKLLSIPRDTYTEIIGRGTMDKINHAYAFGGASMSINTVQNLFDVPIDYYVSVNMQGLKDIIDSLGGVEVTPPISFTQDDYTFTEGVTTKVDGDAALAYSRNRKSDPSGDYGRQERQRQLIEASLKKVASLSSVVRYQGVLESLEKNMTTNLSFDDLLDLFNKYRSAADTVDQLQLEGYGEYIDGIYYEIIPEEEVARVSDILQEELEVNE